MTELAVLPTLWNESIWKNWIKFDHKIHDICWNLNLKCLYLFEFLIHSSLLTPRKFVNQIWIHIVQNCNVISILATPIPSVLGSEVKNWSFLMIFIFSLTGDDLKKLISSYSRGSITESDSTFWFLGSMLLFVVAKSFVFWGYVYCLSIGLAFTMFNPIFFENLISILVPLPENLPLK